MDNESYDVSPCTGFACGLLGAVGLVGLVEMASRRAGRSQGAYLLERISSGSPLGWDERRLVRLRLVPCARRSLYGDGNYRDARLPVVIMRGRFVARHILCSIVSFLTQKIHHLILFGSGHVSMCGCTYCCLPLMICVIRAVYFQDRPSGRFRCWQVKPGVPVHEE